MQLMCSCRGNQLPPWVNTSLTATELDKALQNHITTIMDHYRGKLYAWDVIVRHLCRLFVDVHLNSRPRVERNDFGQYAQRNLQG